MTSTHETFDFEKVDDFDRHIALSIPNYEGLVDVFTALCMEYMPPQGTLLDIGCSTGKFLAGLPKVKDSYYAGCDIALVNGIVETAENGNFDFITMSANDAIENLLSGDGHIDVLTSMFTLQFMGTKERRATLDQIKRVVDKGGVALIAEKIFCKSSKINNVLAREHLRQKRKNFSDTEILDKDYQLFGSMFCLELDSIEKELSGVGRYEQVWQSYNFRGWVVY